MCIFPFEISLKTSRLRKLKTYIGFHYAIMVFRMYVHAEMAQTHTHRYTVMFCFCARRRHTYLYNYYTLLNLSLPGKLQHSQWWQRRSGETKGRQYVVNAIHLISEEITIWLNILYDIASAK